MSFISDSNNSNPTDCISKYTQSFCMTGPVWLCVFVHVFISLIAANLE